MFFFFIVHVSLYVGTKRALHIWYLSFFIVHVIVNVLFAPCMSGTMCSSMQTIKVYALVFSLSLINYVDRWAAGVYRLGLTGCSRFKFRSFFL